MVFFGHHSSMWQFLSVVLVLNFHCVWSKVMVPGHEVPVRVRRHQKHCCEEYGLVYWRECLIINKWLSTKIREDIL